MKKLIVVLLIVYLGGYLIMRSTNAEVWPTDGQTYVIFPENPKLLYYAFRPLTYLDASLTGMRFHIGPHR